MTYWYVDGACSLKQNKAGIGIYNKENNISISLCIDTLFDKKTNSIAELYSVKYALKIIKTIQSPFNNNNIILTDSEYVFNSLTKWIDNWKKKNWINSHNKPVMHKDLILEIYNELHDLNVLIKWIPREENFYADKLAKKSIY